jgi:hypothetical protein
VSPPKAAFSKIYYFILLSRENSRLWTHLDAVAGRKVSEF